MRPSPFRISWRTSILRQSAARQAGIQVAHRRPPKVGRAGLVLLPCYVGARRSPGLACFTPPLLPRFAAQLVYDAFCDPCGREGSKGLLVPPDTVFRTYRQRIAELAAAARLPAIYGYRDHVEAGGLISYGPKLEENYRRAATYVDKILKGAKPSDLPVEQPTKFELVINLKTAKALGLEVPPTLLARADEVIE